MISSQLFEENLIKKNLHMGSKSGHWKYVLRLPRRSLWNGILLPKLFWPTVRKKCSCDQEKILKFEAEGREFANILRSLEQFIQTVKGQNNFW